MDTRRKEKEDTKRCGGGWWTETAWDGRVGPVYSMRQQGQLLIAKCGRKWVRPYAPLGANRIARPSQE